MRRWYPEVRFGGFTNVDGTVAFYTRVNSVLDASFVVLDLGCGRGAAASDRVPWRRGLRQLKRRCDRVIGADVDPTAATNPFIDEFRLIEEGRIPLPDGCVDVCVSDSVVEHVENVDSFFSECARVIRSGGYLFIRTPNIWGYPAIASRVVPHRFHAALVRRTQEDVFPTVYRLQLAPQAPSHARAPRVRQRRSGCRSRAGIPLVLKLPLRVRRATPEIRAQRPSRHALRVRAQARASSISWSRDSATRHSSGAHTVDRRPG